MRTTRWLSGAALAVCLILLAIDAMYLRAVVRERIELSARLQEMREAQAARPPHECGTVIMPGETCQQTLTIVIPATKEPTF